MQNYVQAAGINELQSSTRALTSVSRFLNGIEIGIVYKQWFVTDQRITGVLWAELDVGTGTSREARLVRRWLSGFQSWEGQFRLTRCLTCAVTCMGVL